jgi:hypothetical protein
MLILLSDNLPSTTIKSATNNEFWRLNGVKFATGFTWQCPFRKYSYDSISATRVIAWYSPYVNHDWNVKSSLLWDWERAWSCLYRRIEFQCDSTSVNLRLVIAWYLSWCELKSKTNHWTFDNYNSSLNSQQEIVCHPGALQDMHFNLIAAKHLRADSP